MNNMKKLASILLALVMVLAMATTAFALDIDVENMGTTGSTYSAYRILDAEVTDGKYTYSVTDKYRTILQTVTGKTEDTAIIQYISELGEDNSADVQAFADDVYAAIVAAGTAVDGTANADNNYLLDDVAEGYWLIAETEMAGDNDTRSLVMLATAGADISVETKESTPELDKEIVLANDTTTDATTVAVGDKVDFQLTGTVSNKYANYDKYQYTFKDNLSEGLTLCDVSEVKIYIDGVEYTGDKFVKTINGQNLTVACEDLKQITEVTASSEIKVTYSATVNEDAVKGGEGNLNEAILEFSNDPSNSDGTGETPEDTTAVFTFDVVVDKVDGSKNPLDGAGFTLYIFNEETSAWDEVEVIEAADDLVKFTFEGLNVGKYKLVETTVPDGYNKAEDIEFEITATIEDEELTAIDGGTKFVSDVDNGTLTTEVMNQFGSVLPSTGGIGTTIFYIVGGLLAVAAVILLITKKRMNSDK